jgi:hypothetical protein
MYYATLAKIERSSLVDMGGKIDGFSINQGLQQYTIEAAAAFEIILNTVETHSCN